mmetsp:Transcript_68247/g.172663  ORF Transcript_68247/g.172663 Transcript_68247/m.172663 type:complete len:536 (-) Transcript_68247:224-1831(-)
MGVCSSSAAKQPQVPSVVQQEAAEDVVVTPVARQRGGEAAGAGAAEPKTPGGGREPKTPASCRSNREPVGSPASSAAGRTPVERRDVKKDTISGSQFIMSNPSKIGDVYNMEEKKIGEGTYGSVVRGKHRVTNNVRAIKVISKGQLNNQKNMEKFKREIEIMKVMDHPNIIKLFETFEDQRNVYLAMELCSGGELFDRIIEAGHLTEREAAIVVQQILRAIFYMHDKCVSHRDLKPENFLFSTKDAIERSILKIIDFGLSCTYKPGQVLSTRAGTPYYVAPQVLAGRYDHMCDLWSVGVIMYILLCGYPPFYGRNDQEVLTKVKKGNYSFDDKDWARVSSDAKGLIRKLICFNPRDRFTAEQALNHAWIKQTAPRASAASLRANPALVENLRGFRSQNMLKKAALQIIAGQLDETQIRGLRETFTALDANGDGLLTLSELKSGLDRAGFKKTNSDLEGILEGVDADGSGVIDYSEFLAAALDKKQYLSEQACWTAFKVFDLDGDGRLNLAEFQAMVRGVTRDDRGAVDGEAAPSS